MDLDGYSDLYQYYAYMVGATATAAVLNGLAEGLLAQDDVPISSHFVANWLKQNANAVESVEAFGADS